jgi:hypothetical protein
MRIAGPVTLIRVVERACIVLEERMEIDEEAWA